MLQTNKISGDYSNFGTCSALLLTAAYDITLKPQLKCDVLVY